MGYSRTDSLRDPPLISDQYSTRKETMEYRAPSSKVSKKKNESDTSNSKQIFQPESLVLLNNSKEYSKLLSILSGVDSQFASSMSKVHKRPPVFEGKYDVTPPVPTISDTLRDHAKLDSGSSRSTNANKASIIEVNMSPPGPTFIDVDFPKPEISMRNDTYFAEEEYEDPEITQKREELRNNIELERSKNIDTILKLRYLSLAANPPPSTGYQGIISENDESHAHLCCHLANEATISKYNRAASECGVILDESCDQCEHGFPDTVTYSKDQHRTAIIRDDFYRRLREAPMETKRYVWASNDCWRDIEHRVLTTRETITPEEESRYSQLFPDDTPGTHMIMHPNAYNFLRQQI